MTTKTIPIFLQISKLDAEEIEESKEYGIDVESPYSFILHSREDIIINKEGGFLTNINKCDSVKDLIEGLTEYVESDRWKDFEDDDPRWNDIFEFLRMYFVDYYDMSLTETVVKRKWAGDDDGMLKKLHKLFITMEEY